MTAPQMAWLAAEVLRLREQAARRDEADALMAHTRNAELDALRAEVERLREALKSVVAEDDQMVWGEDSEYREAFRRASEIVRTALGDSHD
jgi:hypothetical protein